MHGYLVKMLLNRTVSIISCTIHCNVLWNVTSYTVQHLSIFAKTHGFMQTTYNGNEEHYTAYYSKLCSK